MARRKRAQKPFTESLKRNESGGVKITKKTIDDKCIFDFFNGFSPSFADDKTVLQSIITECAKNGIEYTLSAYCKSLLA